MNTHTSEGPVNHRLGGVRKCRGLFEVKLSWHEVHTSRHNRGSLSRPIIPTSNKWRATSWRVLVALILFILPFMRTFLLHLMAPVKECSTVLEDTDTEPYSTPGWGQQIEILGILDFGNIWFIVRLLACGIFQMPKMLIFLWATHFLPSNHCHISKWIDNIVFYYTQSPYIKETFIVTYIITISPRLCSWCKINCYKNKDDIQINSSN